MQPDTTRFSSTIILARWQKPGIYVAIYAKFDIGLGGGYGWLWCRGVLRTYGPLLTANPQTVVATPVRVSPHHVAP